MSKEGSLDAPIRHPIDFEHPDFLNPEKLDAETVSYTHLTLPTKRIV